jgi:hypothetical protein
LQGLDCLFALILYFIDKFSGYELVEEIAKKGDESDMEDVHILGVLLLEVGEDGLILHRYRLRLLPLAGHPF